MNDRILPNHVGIIMDGNGRWAKNQSKNRSFGHKAGSKNVDRIVSHAFSLGIKSLTLYAFSTENWCRPKEEVDELMRLLELYFKKFISKVLKNNVKLNVIGDISVLSPKLNKIINECIAKSSNNTQNVLNVAINYGGRQEIVNSVNKILSLNLPVTVENILQNLYTAGSGEPDLIIRTGGEIRLSNFMLFQGAYSELYFTDVLWPDFDENCFDLAMTEFSKRQRRFGGV